jgi:hypothetical protein
MSQHWFDRLSMTAAEGQGVSRRSAFKGAAAGVFAASALSSPRVARAAAHLEVRAAQESCRGCVYRVVDSENKQVHKCVATGGKSSRFVKKKKKPKAPPIPSAETINCIMGAQLRMVILLDGCRTKDCPNQGLPPLDGSTPSPGGPTTSGCPPGTTSCSGTQLCCYGGDACCPCAGADGGVICCAAVIGCTCC